MTPSIIGMIASLAVGGLALFYEIIRINRHDPIIMLIFLAFSGFILSLGARLIERLM